MILSILSLLTKCSKSSIIMDFLKRFTIQSSSPADNTPDPYADDDIYPVHVLDDTKALRSMLITCTFCFNNVLDVDKLQSSLAKLLEMGDWRKLGGRLRLKVGTRSHISFINSTSVLIQRVGQWQTRNPRPPRFHAIPPRLLLHTRQYQYFHPGPRTNQETAPITRWKY